MITIHRVSVINPASPNKFCVGFATEVSKDLFKVKTIFGISELKRAEINRFFETKEISTNIFK